MLSYELYKVLHLFGILLLFTGLGGLTVAAYAGGAAHGLRKLALSLHGVALLLILVGGFGLLARLEIHHFPGWLQAKVGIWVLMGAALVGVKRLRSFAALWLVLLPAIGAVAAALAIFKP